MTRGKSTMNLMETDVHPKRVTYLERRPDVPVAEFRAHWAGSHADIAREFPGLLSYHQNHTLESQQLPGAHEPYDIDGIVELWFADSDAVSASAESDVVPRLIADEPTFLAGLSGAAVHAPGASAFVEPFSVWLLASWRAGAEREKTLQAIDELGHALGSSPAVNRLDEGATPLHRDTLHQDDDLPALAVAFPAPSLLAAEALAIAVRDGMSGSADLRRGTVLVAETLRII